MYGQIIDSNRRHNREFWVRKVAFPSLWLASGTAWHYCNSPHPTTVRSKHTRRTRPLSLSPSQHQSSEEDEERPHPSSLRLLHALSPLAVAGLGSAQSPLSSPGLASFQFLPAAMPLLRPGEADPELYPHCPGVRGQRHDARVPRQRRLVRASVPAGLDKPLSRRAQHSDIKSVQHYL